MSELKQLSPPSQLLVRQAAAIDAQALLAVNSPDRAWRTSVPVTGCWHLHAGFSKLWQHDDSSLHHFGAEPPSGAFAGAIVWLPKEKKLTDYLLAALASCLPADAPVWLLGENRSGIKSIHKQISAPYGAVQKVANGNHSTLLLTRLSTPTPGFDPESYRVCETLAQPPLTPLKLASYPGVFAYPGIDAGSEMLLQHLPQFKAGKLLDFACGHGVLGAWLQRQQEALEVTYLDVSAMALKACAKTLELNGLRGELIAADKLEPGLPQFDVIVSHPPFHTGQATDYTIGQQFLRNARQHLTPKGELWLVANRFLPWPELIEASFDHCQRVAQDNKFAVYRAVSQVASPTARRGRR
ncbi:class I SAM-dependent methyltransferase [Pseudidiomarina insulisalsae]|uniref:Ribosomal RNA small subunit methyltransferase C n=1 Tax=Pseudidiomarina insulisalsae TaxID=575789 RepID=A0A432YNG9_9GAMM|nr:class I SAM-dependent methyltransferase [Pseudidiomarina insulisalsae]RUO62537.1 16S rRNA methyltransferase [Pseudidiomarina insulisalsae]